jgi:hypothetical protein
MNKSKLQVPAHLRKKMNKAIRSTVPAKEPKLTSDDIKAKTLLSTLPPKIRKKDAAFLAAVEKIIETKKTKRTAQHSKRTNSGIDKESAPRHPHMENERWIQSLGRQTAVKNKTLNRKLSKKK